MSSETLQVVQLQQPEEDLKRIIERLGIWEQGGAPGRRARNGGFGSSSADIDVIPRKERRRMIAWEAGFVVPPCPY